MHALEGTATYTGSALGIYTKDAAAAGWFSARARLTANFGGESAPDDDGYTLTGTIDEFVLSGNELNQWSVTLSGNAPTGGSGNVTIGDWSGATDGGGGAGRFTAAFRGSLPNTLAGEFNAHFNDGKAVGGFNTKLDN